MDSVKDAEKQFEKFWAEYYLRFKAERLTAKEMALCAFLKGCNLTMKDSTHQLSELKKLF